jgi:hypothetical protein
VVLGKTSQAWPRSWIEQGFKDLKRGGWQWQKTRIRDPKRAARLWLALAVATFWVISVGGIAEQNFSQPDLEHLPPTHIARRKKSRSVRRRHLSCFSRGLIAIFVGLILQQDVFIPPLIPEPWPLKTYP